MMQERSAARCGCVWRAAVHARACAGWPALVVERERARRAPNVDYGELRRIDEQMVEHMILLTAPERPASR